MARQLDKLIKSLKTIIPTEEKNVHSGLDSILSSVIFSPPENMWERWGDLEELLEDTVGDPDGIQWKERVGRIVRDEEVMPDA